MATDFVNCKVYDVGQGACNFIEIYDSADHSKPSHTILIDLGSVLEHDAAKDVVKQITTTLKRMTTPTIDTVILTHSDVDHINYIKPLLDNFLPQQSTDPGTILGINRVYYGGAYKNYKKGRKKNSLTATKPYIVGNSKTDIIGVGPDQEGWDTKNNVWKQFRSVGGVGLTMLAGNTTTASVDIFTGKKVRKPNTGYLRNMVSVVVILSFAGVDIVVTGDATGLTMARCNQTLAKSGALSATFMATLPHHGSEDTSFNLLNLETPTIVAPLLAEKNVQSFVDNVGAETITASAERHKTYHHPSAHLMSFFWTKVSSTLYYPDPALTPNSRHFYTAYFSKNQFDADPDNSGDVEDWPPSYNWYTAQTSANVFTTMYFLLNRQNSESNDWAAILPPYSPAVKAAKKTKTVPKRVPPTPYVGVTWQFGITRTGPNSVIKSVRPLVNRKALKATGLPIGILGLAAPPLAPAAPVPQAGAHDVPAAAHPRRRPVLALPAPPPRGLDRAPGAALRRLARLP
jgi:hypothetical protein